MTELKGLVTDRVRRVASLTSEGRAWLEQLAGFVEEVSLRWRLRLGKPLEHDGFTALIVPAEMVSGEQAVLKLSFPHMEGRDEAAGLRFWDGDPTVRLLASDERSGAMLLERCVPGHSLNELPAAERDERLARSLTRLWRVPGEGRTFRPLAEMIAYWSGETRADEERWPDPALVREGLAALEELARPSPGDTLLGTDVHAGNVLASQREPWLVIDVRPFLGDPGYDATQHMFDQLERVATDPVAFVRRWAGLLGLDEQRVRAWAFARFAAERRETDVEWRKALEVARRLSAG